MWNTDFTERQWLINGEVHPSNGSVLKVPCSGGIPGRSRITCTVKYPNEIASFTSKEGLFLLQGISIMQTVQSANCGKCGTSCNFVARNGTYCWRCPRYGCQSVIFMREVFITGSHLKLHEIVEISYWWASETSVSKTI